MKLIRALGITMALLSKRRVTATELAAQFEVSIRTIYRDIELINQAGIPISSYAGTDGGFEVMDGFYLTKQHFSLHDLSVIYSLLKGMDGIMSTYPGAIINKLTSLQPALLSREIDNKLILDLTTTNDERSLVQPIMQAIHDRRVVTFSYMDSDGNTTRRSVEPDNLYWAQRFWYLNGYCHLRQADRMFRLSRMSEFEATTRVYSSRVHSRSAQREEPLGIEVHLRFDRSVRRRVQEQFPEAYKESDGCLDVRTLIYRQDYAVSLVLSYGSSVIVLAPDELRTLVRDTARAIIQKYES